VRREPYLSRLLATSARAYLDDELAAKLRGQGLCHRKLRARIVGAGHFSLWNERKRGKSFRQESQGLCGACAKENVHGLGHIDV